MRKLYEINTDIENLLNTATDPETGEVIDTECLDNLLMERDQKLESIALYCKDVNADIVAIQNEIKVLEQRAAKLKNTYEGLKRYLAWALEFKNFTTSKCEITFRKSEQVDVDPDFCKWALEHSAVYFVKTKETYEPDKVEIKKYLKQGGNLKHCRIIEKKNITIK